MMRKINYPKYSSQKTSKIKPTTEWLKQAYLEKHKHHSPAEALQADCLESLACLKGIEQNGRVEANKMRSAMFLVDKVLGTKVIAEVKSGMSLSELLGLYGLAEERAVKKAVKKA